MVLWVYSMEGMKYAQQWGVMLQRKRILNAYQAIV